MKRPPAHPLIGRMERLATWQIKARLEEMPPTPEEAAILAEEERRRPGGDRASVWRALDRIMKTATVVCAFMLTACATVQVQPPAKAFSFYAQPLDPEPWYEQAMEHMEDCTGLEGHFEAVEWFIVAPGRIGEHGLWQDSDMLGLWSRPSRIYLDARITMHYPTLVHELLHYLYQEGNDLHANPTFMLCAGLIG